jgi:hypothetical protein
MSEERNNKKSLDEKILGALLLMSKNKNEGINYLQFIREDNLVGAEELLANGYAKKIKVKDILKNESENYKLTEKGEEYLTKILKLAYKEFK